MGHGEVTYFVKFPDNTLLKIGTPLNRKGEAEYHCGNAEFIADARQDITALLAEVKRLKKERHAAVAELGKCDFCKFRSTEICRECDDRHGIKWEWRGVRE